MKLKHQIKGLLLTCLDRCIQVKPLARSNTEQCSLDRESRRIQLYFCKTCLSSVKIKRHCELLGLRVVEKDVLRINAYRNELIHGGGVARVPCLRVEGKVGTEPRWLYGIDAILEYLNRRFQF